MDISKVQQQVALALKQLAAELDAGRSERLVQFLAAMGRFHRYSVGNLFLILMQRPNATQVAGFRTWKSLGRHVRSGEKGIVILAPMLCRLGPDPDADPEQEDPAPERVTRYRAVYVFDLSQTDGKPLPDIGRPSGDPGAATDRLKQYLAAREIHLEYSRKIAPSDGVSLGGRILIRPGLTPAEEFSVLVHELAHELLHHVDANAPQPAALRELEAEAVAYAVSTASGLDPRRCSSDYILLYRGSTKLLMSALDRVQRTATQILSAVQSEKDR